MGRDKGDKVLADPGQVLSGLAEELKQLVTLIARQSEYLSSKQSNKHINSIEQTTSSALKLIDSYLLYAQAEYGQQALRLQPYGIGSILRDVYEEIAAHPPTKDRLVVAADYSAPVMCNKKALSVALACIFRIINGTGSTKRNIFLVSHRQRGGDIFAGVFAKQFSIKNTELDRAKELVGKSNMALANQTYQNGVDLIIADGLARSQGTRLGSYKYRGMNGLGIRLFKSQQLSLV